MASMQALPCGSGRPLYHRSAGDLHRIFVDLGTGMAVEQEANGVNLFAVLSS